jgi:hypothetical protein
MARFSPDGRFVAYQTNESGRFEIVVQTFPLPSGKWQISTNGGSQPLWSEDGKELFFVAPNGNLMATPVMLQHRNGPMLKAGSPHALFLTHIVGSGISKYIKWQYAVSRDGRFLINQPTEATTPPITLLINWHP